MAINKKRLKAKQYQKTHDMDQEEAKAFLLETIDPLYCWSKWLCFGTALGAYRDGQFIPYDTDIDLGFFMTQKANVVPLLNEKLITRRTNDIITLTKDNISIDLYFFDRTHKDWYTCDKYRIEEYQLGWGFSEVEFCGTDFNMVINPSRYFRKLYGENWRTPIKNKHAQS